MTLARKEDTSSDMEYIVKKILSLKLFPAEEDETLSKQWARSVTDIQGEVLCVSQFTLFATTRKGSKPDFHNAMATQPSKDFYASFLKKMGETYDPSRIKDGEFGAMMSVSLTNEGPVTILLDSNDTRSGSSTNASNTTSGSSTPNPAASTEKEADKARYVAEKQRKREETERRQRENAERKALKEATDTQ